MNKVLLALLKICTRCCFLCNASLKRQAGTTMSPVKTRPYLFPFFNMLYPGFFEVVIGCWKQFQAKELQELNIYFFLTDTIPRQTGNGLCFVTQIYLVIENVVIKCPFCKFSYPRKNLKSKASTLEGEVLYGLLEMLLEIHRVDTTRYGELYLDHSLCKKFLSSSLQISC